MSLPFLCDQCVPASIGDLLRAAGHRVVLLREVLPIRAINPDVLGKAQQIDAVLLSLNGDFSDIVAYPPARSGGIVAVQLHNHPETIPSLMRHLISYLAANPSRDFCRGKLLLAEAHRMRLRQ